MLHNVKRYSPSFYLLMKSLSLGYLAQLYVTRTDLEEGQNTYSTFCSALGSSSATDSSWLSSWNADVLVDSLKQLARKPYTIAKQRERLAEEEHKKFLEDLKLHACALRRIEEHIGTKTAVQIRSHAQKFFSKVTINEIRDMFKPASLDLISDRDGGEWALGRV